MSLISPSDQQVLRDEFAQMTRPVRLLFFTQTLGCETCLSTRQILDELPALTERVTIEEINFILEPDRAREFGVDRVPTVAVAFEENGQLQDSRIRFVGMPGGYEFVSLVQAVRLAGGGPSALSAESRQRLAEVDRPVALQVFTTPT